MIRYAVALVFWAIFASSAAQAAAADLFTVSGIPVDATADSATAARDRALAEGRPVAWQRLFRRLTPSSAWGRQPQLDDTALQRIIRSFDVANERRSTTRYLADITFHFNGGEVQRILRGAGVPFAETQARPVLVIPIVGGRFIPGNPWARAWTTPAVAQGVVPVVLPTGDAADREILDRPNLAQLTWEDFAPLVRRYGVGQVIIATASPDGNAAQLTALSATGRQTDSLAFARSTFAATAEQAALKIAEDWKARSAVDYNQRGRLLVDVEFDSLEDWMKIRTQLGSIRSVTDVDVLGLSVGEARIDMAYVGRQEQLRDVLTQQNLDFRPAGGGYVLQLGATAASAAP